MRTLLVTFALCLGSGAPAQYAPGFVWDRHADWTQPARYGLGNPDDDSNRNAAWMYVAANPNGSPAFQWAAFGGEPLVWNDSARHWRRGAGGEYPIATRDAIYYESDPTTFTHTPCVRWRNPTGREIVVRIEGSFDISWVVTGQPLKTDLSIMRFNAAAESDTLLMGQAVTAPAGPFPSMHVPIAPLTLALGPGDEVHYSVKRSDSSGGGYGVVGVVDALTITLLEVGCASDINADGSVNFLDLNELLSAFGIPCD